MMKESKTHAACRDGGQGADHKAGSGLQRIVMSELEEGGTKKARSEKDGEEREEGVRRELVQRQREERQESFAWTPSQILRFSPLLFPFISSSFFIRTFLSFLPFRFPLSFFHSHCIPTPLSLSSLLFSASLPTRCSQPCAHSPLSIQKASFFFLPLTFSLSPSLSCFPLMYHLDTQGGPSQPSSLFPLFRHRMKDVALSFSRPGGSFSLPLPLLFPPSLAFSSARNCVSCKPRQPLLRQLVCAFPSLFLLFSSLLFSKELCVLQAETAALATTGTATGSAKASAAASDILGESEIKQAEYVAQSSEKEATIALQTEITRHAAELEHQKQLDALAITRSQHLAQIESSKFERMINAISKRTIQAIAQAGPELQSRLLKALGLKGYLVTDGSSPINLFTTAKVGHKILGERIAGGN